MVLPLVMEIYVYVDKAIVKSGIAWFRDMKKATATLPINRFLCSFTAIWVNPDKLNYHTYEVLFHKIEIARRLETVT
jgi:hypothetical protein